MSKSTEIKTINDDVVHERMGFAKYYFMPPACGCELFILRKCEHREDYITAIESELDHFKGINEKMQIFGYFM